MKKVLFTLAAVAFGLFASAQDKPGPVLKFGTDANNLVSEIELAPGESTQLEVVLTEQQETVVMGFQMQWLMKDSKGELTEAVVGSNEIPDDPDFPMDWSWTAPMTLSTAIASQGGLPGNALACAHPEFATWRWVGTNMQRNQFWWPRQTFVCPISVAKIALKANDDWADEYATFEFDQDYYVLNQTPETKPASFQNYEVFDMPEMVLKIKNKNYTPAPVDVDLTGSIVLGNPTEDGMLAISYDGPEADVVITVTVNGEEVELTDGMVQLQEGENNIVVTVGGEGYNDLVGEYTVTWTAPQPPVQTPAPEIIVTPGDDAYTFEAVGEGTVHLYVDEQEVENPYTVARTDVDQIIKISAVAHVDGQIDGTVTGEYMVPALVVPQPQVTPEPQITYEVTDDAVIITATGEGEVLLYVNGEPVENPCTIERGEQDEVVVVTATAQGEDMLISEEVSMEIVIPAVGGETPDPHMTGYWIVLLDENNNEVWWPLNEDPDDDNWYIMRTLHHQPWNLEVPFYFMVNGVRYGAETNMQLPAMGDAQQTILNPVFEGENYWYVPSGYTYTWGLQFVGGEIYLLVSQGKMTGIDEIADGKTVAGVRYFNMAGQEMQEANGMTIVVTTYTDGTTSAVKVMK